MILTFLLSVLFFIIHDILAFVCFFVFLQLMNIKLFTIIPKSLSSFITAGSEPITLDK